MGDIAIIGTGGRNSNQAIEDGEYPFFTRGEKVQTQHDYDFDETAIITAGDGVGVGKVIHFYEGKYALHQRAYRIVIEDSAFVPRFIFHFMKANFLNYMEKMSFHSSVTSVRRHMLTSLPIPVIPVDDQKRIASILDKFDTLVNDISEGIPAEIEARRQQYEYYRDELLTFKEKVA